MAFCTLLARLRTAAVCSAALVFAAGAGAQSPSASAAAPKVLRYAFLIAETGFDPAQVSDQYSTAVISHIFEPLYEYDYLARPVKVRPLTAAALPEVSADFKTFTIRIKPGIYFADDPVFKGQRRELVAADYVYSLKRFADPAFKAPFWVQVQNLGLLGLDAQRERALKTGQPFDYDTPIEGLRALDRYTLQLKVAAPRPRLIYTLAMAAYTGAVAREVVQAHGPQQIMAHPVGTGPFVLAQWRRSSRIVLQRNPGYRERYYEAEPAADDAEGQALLARFKGRRLPMLDRVEISIIEESQPRWLSFVNGEMDLVDRVPPEFVNVALPHGRVAPNLAARGIRLHRMLGADTAFTFFNVQHPMLGGMSPERVALRRALSLALDVGAEVRQVRRGQAVVAQSFVLPNTHDFDPSFKSENGEYDPARARALLDLYGYKDRDGDGWRDMPDGSPLVIEVASQPTALDRQYNELWQRNFAAVGVRTHFTSGKWPEQLKQARNGQLMLWFLGESANTPDSIYMLQYLYGPSIGAQNYSRFQLDAYDRLYERLQELPDGPERRALFREAERIQVAYMPLKSHVFRYLNDMSQPWLIGYRRPAFGSVFWHYVDVQR
ncbi:ABC transporter substrate-binding protein [Roseateles sp. BYS180W]|uniref:ABC transporter substrate-binding protein n=1 Tax=Roseateles rivi TaxID=3299028 RepID=A0ABW7FUH7_9BURK